MMKVIGINGSPRKGWNSEKLVKAALDGAQSAGAEVELIQLYAEPLKGCLECFACKRKGNKTGGLCAIRDNVRPILEKCLYADAVIISSPNYFGYPSGMVRCFLERFLYPLTSYEVENGERVRILGKRIIPSGIIFTMNSNEEFYGVMNYGATLGATRTSMEYVLGYAEEYDCYDTLQFSDYSKMDANFFDETAKRKRHEEHFPVDRQNCFELGSRLVHKAKELN